MKILHVNYKNIKSTKRVGKYYEEPKKKYEHMFCLYEKDNLKHLLDKYDIKTNITATIIHYNMDDCDWRFIQTSEI